MPTAKLIYDLETEAKAFEAATKGADLAMAMECLGSILRSRIKHDDHISEAQREVLRWVRTNLCATLDDYGIDLDRLI